MADETSNSAVVLLCGIPASGKSTLSKEIHRYAKKTRGDTIHVIYICYDDFIPRDLNLNNAIAGSQLPDKLYEEDIAKEQTKCRSESDTIESSNYSLWKHYRRILLAAVDRLLNTMKNKNNEFRFDSYNSTSEIEGLPPFHMFWKTFHENLSKEITNCSCFSPMDCRLTDTAHIILVDDNMFYHSMRYEYVQLARKYGLGFAEVFLECHLETALKRNNLRSHPVSLHTMQAIFAKMEPPDPQKFPWEHYHLTLKEEGELNAQTLENVVQLILEAQRNPLISEHEDSSEVKEASRVACLRSIVHQADQILRKYITKAIAEAKGSGKGKKELQTLASQLNKQKKVFLESVHNLKNHPHRSNTVQTVMNSTGQCLAGNEEWETSETSVSVRDLADSQKESQHGDQNCGQDTLNNSPWTSYSCFDNRRTHLCLQCFPKLEDREEFQLFVENLFKVLLL